MILVNFIVSLPARAKLMTLAKFCLLTVPLELISL
jgi:hypothetical protein